MDAEAAGAPAAGCTAAAAIGPGQSFAGHVFFDSAVRPGPHIGNAVRGSGTDRLQKACSNMGVKLVME